MLGTGVRADFEHCEVALFVGKNPWQSHGFPHARTMLKEIANDPARSIIVIDPRRTETAELADFHLQVRPGTDAWCSGGDGGGARAGGPGRTVVAGRARRRARRDRVAVRRHRRRRLRRRAAASTEELLRTAARRIAAATGSVAVVEDLGVQMNRHSTLNSWLEKLVWMLTGNLAVPGAQYAPTSLVSLFGSSRSRSAGEATRVSPVVGARIISGLVPCNVIPEEILTDHPRRYRAMLVESGNPAHSLADSSRMREALDSLDSSS